MDAPGIASPSRETEIAQLGTRFLVYPQPPFVPGYERPEVVWLPTPPGQIAAGPADRRIYVVDPIEAKAPYGFPYLPPYSGALHPPAEPGPDGHFDHLERGSRQFLAAHVYACVRRVLDVCQGYLGREVPWFFEPTLGRLEIVPRLAYDNAHSGFGFLEMGESEDADPPFPYALNFDAIAHETGHLILLGMLGTPRSSNPPLDFFCYHEAIADFVSLIALLHFDTALDRVLRRTRGNLLITNELDRFTEQSDERQIRSFGNSLTMGDVSGDVHDRSKPFAGALFDALIEIYQLLLLDRGLSRLDPRHFANLRTELDPRIMEDELSTTSQDYEFRHFATKAALAEARDAVGTVLVHSWLDLDPDTLSYEGAAEALVEAAEAMPDRRFAGRFEENFVWRGIL